MPPKAAFVIAMMSRRISCMGRPRLRRQDGSSAFQLPMARVLLTFRRTKSNEFDKLLFSHDTLCFIYLIFDTISDASIRLDGHLANNCVDVCLLNSLSTPWSLGKVTNVRVWLMNMGHCTPFRCLQASTW